MFLSDGFVFFVVDVFVDDVDIFVFVRFGWVVGVDVGGDGIDELFVVIFDFDFCLVGYGDFDVFWDVEKDWV